MNTDTNDKVCPFCKGDNQCMVNCDKPCWCAKVKVPTGLQDLVPQELRRKSCICQNCVTEYLENPERFKSKYRQNSSS